MRRHGRGYVARLNPDCLASPLQPHSYRLGRVRKLANVGTLRHMETRLVTKWLTPVGSNSGRRCSYTCRPI